MTAMASGTPAGERDVLGCLADASTALGACADTSAWVLRDADLLAAAVAAQRHAAAVAELTARLLAEVDSRGLGVEAGAVSTAAWLRSQTKLTAQAAGDRVRLGGRLARHEATRAALARGEVMVEQSSVITRALDALPDTVEPEQVVAAEAHLLEQSRLFDARDLARLGRRLLEVIDPEAADAHEAARLEAEEEHARASASFSIRSRGDGTSRGSFVLPNAQASMLRTVLEAISSPRRHASTGDTTGDTSGATPATDAHHDPPDPEGSGDTGGINDTGGSGGTGGGRTGGSPAGTWQGGRDTSGAGFGSSDDPVPYPRRMGLALAALCEHLPTDKLPQAGGISVNVVVNLDYDQLLSGLGSATLSTGEVVSAAQARRMACSAGIIPAVFGGASLPLDLGRRRRLHSAAQRTALAITQQGCVYGECDRPAAWCEGHHAIAWSAGGRTDLDTAALLCPRHHDVVHAQGWQIVVDDAGIPHTIPPASIDPSRRRRIHPRFREPPPRHGPHRNRDA